MVLDYKHCLAQLVHLPDLKDFELIALMVTFHQSQAADCLAPLFEQLLTRYIHKLVKNNMAFSAFTFLLLLDRPS